MYCCTNSSYNGLEWIFLKRKERNAFFRSSHNGNFSWDDILIEHNVTVTEPCSNEMLSHGDRIKSFVHHPNVFRSDFAPQKPFLGIFWLNVAYKLNYVGRCNDAVLQSTFSGWACTGWLTRPVVIDKADQVEVRWRHINKLHTSHPISQPAISWLFPSLSLSLFLSPLSALPGNSDYVPNSPIAKPAPSNQETRLIALTLIAQETETIKRFPTPLTIFLASFSATDLISMPLFAFLTTS